MVLVWVCFGGEGKCRDWVVVLQANAFAAVPLLQDIVASAAEAIAAAKASRLQANAIATVLLLRHQVLGFLCIRSERHCCDPPAHLTTRPDQSQIASRCE